MIRSLRVLPHQQNTGGFFVAVLKKVAPLPWESTKTVETTTTKVEEDKDSVGVEAVKEEKAPRSPTRKKRRIQGFKEDPYIFFEKDEQSWPSIK